MGGGGAGLGAVRAPDLIPLAGGWNDEPEAAGVLEEIMGLQREGLDRDRARGRAVGPPELLAGSRDESDEVDPPLEGGQAPAGEELRVRAEIDRRAGARGRAVARP